MNCSSTADVQNRQFLHSNFGALAFMVIYIGIYGTGLIVYFACQFLADSRDNHEYEISSEFFITLQHVNERQEIYSIVQWNVCRKVCAIFCGLYLDKLTNKNLVKQMYSIYYSDVPYNTKLIEEKVNQCSQKYHKKIENLKSKHQYYVIDTPATPALTDVSCVSECTTRPSFLRSLSTL